MTDFFEKISCTKKQKNQDIITTKLDDKIISLRVIDTSPETIHLSTKWRQNNLKWFNSTFAPTEKKTNTWIENTILKDPGRIVFMIYLDEKKIGQTGLDRYVTKDNSVDISGTLKDPSVHDPRVMQYTRKALLRWAFTYLDMSKVIIRVFSDNYKNIRLIEKCGGLTTDSIPMKKKIRKDASEWIETTLNSDDEIAERYLNIMEITKENFNKT